MRAVRDGQTLKIRTQPRPISDDLEPGFQRIVQQRTKAHEGIQRATQVSLGARHVFYDVQVLG